MPVIVSVCDTLEKAGAICCTQMAAAILATFKSLHFLVSESVQRTVAVAVAVCQSRFSCLLSQVLKSLLLRTAT